jgi:hypothetical protein
MKTISLAPLLLLTLALPVAAQAYKCRQPDGRTEISSEPCGAGSKTLKEIEDENVPEENRLRAEREAERQRELVEKNEKNRQAVDKQEREERERAERQRLAAEARARPAEPVYVPVPYYTPGYVRPPYYPNRPHPEPVPPMLTPRPGKPVDLYKVPGNTRGR